MPNPIYFKRAPTSAAIGIGFLIFSTIFFSPAANAAPNIIVILADDLGWSDISVNQSTFYRTPNLEKLASQGMVFQQAYAAPEGIGTRAGILSGQYAGARHSIFSTDTELSRKKTADPFSSSFDPAANPFEAPSPSASLIPPKGSNILPHNISSIATELSGAGYQCLFVGKWGLSGGPTFDPTEYGFRRVVEIGDATLRSQFSPYGANKLPDGPVNEYLTDRLTTEAVRLMEASRARGPFFLMLSHYGVHAPWEAKADKVEAARKRVQRDSRQQHPVYAAMIESLDESVGAILQAVDQMGIQNNTLIFFLSDNGGVERSARDVFRNTPGKDGLQNKDRDTPITSNYPLRGEKGSLLEGGIRVPFIASWPTKIQPNQTNDTPICYADIYPTIRMCAGITAELPHPVDGENLWPLFNQVETRDPSAWTRDALFCHFPTGSMGAMVRMGDWKLIRSYGAGPKGGPKYELYHVTDDPGEIRDQSDAEPNRVRTMSARLSKWLGETGAKLPRRRSYKP